MRTPKSPTSFSERQVPPGILEARAETSVPSEAFGGVSNRLEESEQQTGNLLIKVQDQADQFQVQSAKNAFTVQRAKFMAGALTSDGMNAASYSPDLEKGSYQTWYGNAAKSVSTMAKNSRQAKEINEFLGNQNADMNVILQKHVATNLFKANLKGSVDGIQNTINLVPTSINDMGSLIKLRDGLKDQVQRASDLAGSQDTTTQKNLESQYSNFDQLAIKSFLANKDVKGATDYINHLKSTGAIDDKKIVPLEGVVHGYQTKQDAENWYSTKGRFLRDSTGNPDLKSIQNSIDNMKIPQADKDSYIKVARTLSGADIKANLESHKASWENFKNWASKNSDNFQKVISPAEVHAQSLIYGRDSQDAYALEKWYNSQYQKESNLTLNFGSKELQNQHFSDVRSQVALGEIGSLKSLESIQDSFTPKQFTQLKNEWFKTMIGGNDSQRQIVLRRIHQMGVDVYGNDAAGLNNYTNAMLDKYHKLGAEGDANTLIKEAGDYLKGENPKSSTIWKGYADKQNQNGYLQPDQIRAMYTDYGKEVTDALGQTLTKSLGRTPTANDFQGAIDSFGGPEALKRFTPSNNAILSIIRWNSEHPHYQPIQLNKDNIDKAVQKYQETGGIF